MHSWLGTNISCISEGLFFIKLLFTASVELTTAVVSQLKNEYIDCFEDLEA